MIFPLAALTSGIDFAASALLLGILVTAGFVLPGTKPKELTRALLIIAISILILFLGIEVLSLLIQGANLRSGAFPSLAILLRYVTMTQIGKVWLFREIYAAVLALILFQVMKHHMAGMAVRIVAFLALPLIASQSLASHAIAVKDGASLAVMADATHLIAGGLWGGGLIGLLCALQYGAKVLNLSLAWAAEAVHRFSRLAFASVALILTTGLYQSWIQVGHFTVLFTSAYGQVLALKLLLFLATLSIGALNFLSTRPRLLSASQMKNKTDPLVRMALIRIGAESLLALLVFGTTGFLTALPPAVHAAHQTEFTNVSPASSGVHSVAPAEGASVKILSPKPGQVFTSDQVPLRFDLTKGKRGDHIHAYIDGELMGMFMSSDGTLNGVSPGHHVLELRVVTEDHQTELDATDRLEFTVKDAQKKKQ